MKFSTFGRIGLALAASLVLAFGTDSCIYDFTEAYIIVTGSQYNQVASYKEDNETGVLNPAPGGPLSSQGNNPIRAVLLNGGRYVYVLNQGSRTVDSAGNITWKGANIALFSIGGEGTLSPQLTYPSEGLGSVRLAMSTSGNFLYVLDQYQPGPTTNVTPASPTQSAAFPCFDSTNRVYRPAGDITVFSIDPATGRLFLVPNQQAQNAQGTPLPYFPVGCSPIDFHLSSGFMYTAEVSDPTVAPPSSPGQVVYAYQANTNGQLIQVPGGSQQIPGATNITVIGGSSSGTFVYLLDAGTNSIFTFTTGSNGLLSAITGGATPNFSGAAGMDALTTDSNSKFLYVASTQASGLNQSGSVLSAFVITPTSGVLTPLSSGWFPTGSTPVCVFEDPSHQFLYTANAGSSTVTGSLIDPQTGILTNLRRGSSFATVGTPTWCLYSPNTD